MVKNVVFIEKENKPLFEVELLMEYMIDDIYNNIIVHYKKNQISDIILIDKRLDMWRNRLIGCNYLQNENIDSKNKFIFAFNKKNFYANYGFLYKIFNNYFYIKGKNSVYKINRDDCYIFYRDVKTKKERQNDNVRHFLENLLNNKIKIRKNKN